MLPLLLLLLLLLARTMGSLECLELELEAVPCYENQFSACSTVASSFIGMKKEINTIQKCVLIVLTKIRIRIMLYPDGLVSCVHLGTLVEAHDTGRRN